MGSKPTVDLTKNISPGPLDYDIPSKVMFNGIKIDRLSKNQVYQWE